MAGSIKSDGTYLADAGDLSVSGDGPLVRPLPKPVGKRRAAIDIHSHLRELILQGELPPNMILAQTEIARNLGVGVIPVREAFRMLQQEGLIESKPDRRAIVAPVDPVEQDALWAERVLLESLAIRMSVTRLAGDEIAQMEAHLQEMADASREDNYGQWSEAHRNFHTATNRIAGEPIDRRIRSLIDRTSRYMILHGRQLPHSYAGALEDHSAILRAVVQRDLIEAQRSSAMHVGRPALVLLAQLVPSFEPKAVRAALGIAGLDNSAP